MTKVINLYGGPGSGKSTAAAGIFNRMKVRGLKAELVTEVAKDAVYEGHLNILQDQLYLLGMQNRRQARLVGKVDYIITDSPLLLTSIYRPDEYMESFDSLVLQLYNTYNNINFFLHRPDAFEANGRVHDEETSNLLDGLIKHKMWQHGLPYDSIEVQTFNETAIDLMVDKILNT